MKQKKVDAEFVTTYQHHRVLKAGLYEHYKGGIYLVLGVAAHSETGERFAIYVSLDSSRSGARMRARPLEMFHERVRVGVEEEEIPRFRFMGYEVDSDYRMDKGEVRNGN